MEKPILAAMLSCSSQSLSDDEKRLFEKFNPLGISLFGRNIKDKNQIKALIKEVKEVIGRDDVLIAIDQEGGRVRRLAEPEFRPYVSQRQLASIGSDEVVKLHAQLISNDLNDLGINWNYAPVLDVTFPQTTDSLGNRCFSDDEKTVAKLGKIMVDEYVSQGICPCIKHMPGHGRASVDPHLNLPILDYSLKELEKDFYPFKALNKAPAGMTAHMVIKEIDDKLPVTQSKKAIDTLIRGIIGFDGFLISDAIDMKALSGSIGEKAKTSLEAGCDSVCYCFGNYDELVDVCNNCTYLADKSMIRFAKIKNIFNNRAKVSNIDAVEAKYNQLIGDIEKYNDNYDATEVLHKMKQNK